MTSPSLCVAVWGATGVAGSAVTQLCTADPRIDEIRLFTRRLPVLEHPKIHPVLVADFMDPNSWREHLKGVDAVFWCLGVSQSAVSDEGRYRRITYDFTMTAARILLEESPEVCMNFLSGMGADPTGESRLMWARVKGETEADLATVGFQRLNIWRPGYIRQGKALYGRPNCHVPVAADSPISKLFQYKCRPGSGHAVSHLTRRNRSYL